MWLILKLKKASIFKIVKSSLKNLLLTEPEFYSPKIIKQMIKGNKFYQKDLHLLGNYIFVFHEKFKNNTYIKKLNSTKGIDIVLNGSYFSQNEINKFIIKCKKNEDANGYLLQEFFKNISGNNIKFHSGPFVNFISELINIQRNKISVLTGKYKILIDTKKKSLISC